MFPPLPYIGDGGEHYMSYTQGYVMSARVRTACPLCVSWRRVESRVLGALGES